MIDTHISHPWPTKVLEAVARFKQGDLVERPPFFYAGSSRYGVWALTKHTGTPDLPSEVFELDPDQGPPYGLITTQTCDLYEQRSKPRQPWFMVAPVYDARYLLHPSQDTQLRKGMFGHLVLLDPPGLPTGLWVADLRIEIPLEKSWLVGREPIAAFPTERGYLELARRLARRRERPALANVLSNEVVSSLRGEFSRLKADGLAVLDAIREIRLLISQGDRMAPSAAQVLVITHSNPPPDMVKVVLDAWWDEAHERCARQGLHLIGNRYTSLDAMTAAEYVTSVPLDFSYLSPDDDA